MFTRSNSTIIFLSCILFLFVFCVMGLPFTNWWFNGDDFPGMAIAVHTKTWKELFYWFVDGNIWRYAYPSHSPLYAPPGGVPNIEYSCFSFYYRPLYCVYLIIMQWMFGLWAYPFYLANVFFHALNTVLLFRIAAWFVRIIPAMLVALLFAFHPQIGFRFGSIVNLHYYIDLFLILSTLLLFKKYLDTRRPIFYALSCLLFLGALFTRETAIVLPVIIFFGAYLYQNKNTGYSLTTFFQSFWENFWHAFGYGMCAIFYLVLRLSRHPIGQTAPKNIGQTVLTFFVNLYARFYEFVTCAYDLFALSWLPWGYPKLRAVVLGLCIITCLYAFIKNKYKLVVLFFAFCSLLMLWPAFVVNYSPRYFYEAYPFILMTLVTCFTGTRGQPGARPEVSKGRLKKIVLACFALFVCFNIMLTYQNLRCREQKLLIIHNAIDDVIEQHITKNNPHPIIFLSLPIDGFGTGLEQAVWLTYGQENFPIYYDPCMFLVQADSNLITNKNFYAACNDYFDQNYVTITPLPGGFRYQTSNQNKMFFYLDSKYLSLGEKIINQRDNAGRVVDFTIVIDEKYWADEPIFLRWDYETKRFERVNHA